MSNTKDKNQDLDISLQEVSQVSPIDDQTATDLEFVMTNSAFGYQYALTALDEQGDDAFGSDELKQEVDGYKRVYFKAREKLERLDVSRLTKLEKDLQMQKLLVFTKQTYLH